MTTVNMNMAWEPFAIVSVSEVAAVLLLLVLFGLAVRALVKHPKTLALTAGAVAMVLVIIAIVALLASIILPSFARARELAARHRAQEIREVVGARERVAAPARHALPAPLASPEVGPGETPAGASAGETPVQVASPVTATQPSDPSVASTANHRIDHRSIVRTPLREVAAVAALLVMVVLAYLFLDAGTKGYYTWPLRIGSAATFVVFCVLAVRFLRS